MLVIAQLGIETHPFHPQQAEPGAQPQPHANAGGDLPKALGRHARIGHGFVVLPAPLGAGPVADQVALQFDAQGAAVEQPPLQSQAHQGLGPGFAVEGEGIAEGGAGHLAAPGGDGPGVGLPIGQVGNGRGAGHRLAGPQGLGGRLVDVEVLGAGV